jgi:CubicO group peptidase (beta-lactamase class C family)
MAQLISEFVWQPMGAADEAALVCDDYDVALAGGGLYAKADDVARFGQFILDGGTAPQPWLGQWMDRCRAPNAAAQQSFKASPGFFGQAWKEGMYRNQFWVPDPQRGVTLSYGAYEQYIYVDPVSNFVGVVLSSREAPVSAQTHEMLHALSVVSAHLQSLD